MFILVGHAYESEGNKTPSYSSILHSKLSAKHGYVYETVRPGSAAGLIYNGQSSDCMWHKKEVLKSCCGNLPADPNEEKEVEIRDRYPVYPMY